MTFVIGDIHGEITKLKELIKVLEKFKIDELVFIGDYIDKGENSKEVIEYLNDLTSKYRCTFLMGNHEFYWLRYLKENDKDSFEKLKRYGGITTVEDFGLSDFNKDELYAKLYLKNIDFFEKLNLYYENEKYFVIHAGIPPEKFTCGIDRGDIESYLTQRYDFLLKQDLYGGKKVIFGHTGFVYPYYDGYKIGIDTSAVYGYNLTAFCISDDFFINDIADMIKLDEIDLKKSPIIPRNLPIRLKI